LLLRTVWVERDMQCINFLFLVKLYLINWGCQKSGLESESWWAAEVDTHAENCFLTWKFIPPFSIYSFPSIVHDKKREPLPGKFGDTSN
jgi:hypothetical protein